MVESLSSAGADLRNILRAAAIFNCNIQCILYSDNGLSINYPKCFVLLKQLNVYWVGPRLRIQTSHTLHTSICVCRHKLEPSLHKFEWCYLMLPKYCSVLVGRNSEYVCTPEAFVLRYLEFDHGHEPSIELQEVYSIQRVIM